MILFRNSALIISDNRGIMLTELLFPWFFSALSMALANWIYLSLTKRKLNHFGKTAMLLYALYVDTCARKHSLAKTMLAAAESVCQYRDCKTIGLRWDDRESEPWVLDWYKRMGYKEIRVESDGHAHFLVKDLTKDIDKEPSSGSDKKDDATEE